MAAHQTVGKLIREWEPEEQSRELEYRDSLIAFLRDRMKNSKIEREYRHNGTTTDIYVRQDGLITTEVFVELKRDLNRKDKLDRLIGQVECLKPKKNHIIVVLCGDTDAALLSRFKEQYKINDVWTTMVSVHLKPFKKTDSTRKGTNEKL